MRNKAINNDFLSPTTSLAAASTWARWRRTRGEEAVDDNSAESLGAKVKFRQFCESSGLEEVNSVGLIVMDHAAIRKSLRPSRLTPVRVATSTLRSRKSC